MPDDYATFLRPMGLAVDRRWALGPRPEGAASGRALINETLCIPGTDRIRTSILACWADMVAGMEANHLSEGVVALTVDLTIRLLAPPVAEEATISTSVLKTGRRTTFCEARITNELGVAFAVSHLTFQSSPRPQDTVGADGLPTLAEPVEPRPPSYPVPFFDYLGFRTVRPGVRELDRVPAVMNPAETLQGGALAALAEAAAEDVSGPVGDMELHYLSAVRVGPGRATAAPMGAEGLTRVEIRDPGNQGRLATLVLAWPAHL